MKIADMIFKTLGLLVSLVLMLFVIALFVFANTPPGFIPTSATAAYWNDGAFVIQHNGAHERDDGYDFLRDKDSPPRYYYYLMCGKGSELHGVKAYFQNQEKVYVIADEGYAILNLADNSYEIQKELRKFDEEAEDIFETSDLFAKTNP